MISTVKIDGRMMRWVIMTEEINAIRRASDHRIREIEFFINVIFTCVCVWSAVNLFLFLMEKL